MFTVLVYTCVSLYMFIMGTSKVRILILWQFTFLNSSLDEFVVFSDHNFVRKMTVYAYISGQTITSRNKASIHTNQKFKWPPMKSAINYFFFAIFFLEFFVVFFLG